MPKLATAFRYLAAGVYIRRVGDAVHIVTTGDSEAPDVGLGADNVATKSNWLTEQEVSVEQFGAIVNEVSPESKGQLVNVGTEEEPFLLTQQQASRFTDVVVSAAETLAAQEPALPTAATREA